ncbi:MAG TPA: cob(I)yrinic acid a,c-diamide adenosyltransferase [Armatimonadota bacterium]|jgi:cob(I)alamin adenosyltransferase
MPKLTQGLVQVYTGDGKGKTTAAVGLAVRAHGAGLKVCFVQFIKGGAPSSELAVLRELGIEVVRPARESSGLMRGVITAEDRQAADATWEFARCAIASGEWDVVILDEINIALHKKLVDLSAFLDALANRPPQVEVIATGRNAPDALRDAANLVTEMCLRKHPFEKGIIARFGIEY